MENSIKSSAINYGLYLGGILSLITVAIWFININLMANMWLGISLLLAIIAFGVVSTAKSKSIQEGFLTFKEAFSSYFITVAIGIAVSLLVSMILFNFIDPEAAKEIQQITVERTISMMEGFGAPAEAIAEAVEKIENQNQYSVVNTLKGLAWACLFQAIIGLIVAAIMKKSNPDA
ncbi:DUF4199 domain-containing protein [Pontimicrobium sp. SW4]|uniref:DUF4199 domain-containing protein n=1 Tax=Pontimicrobium sp. SW4 TaxID=3153519 RepID=A0AAU7BVR4_9FLAO